MILGWLRRYIAVSKDAKSEARLLIERFGGGAYEEARIRAREARLGIRIDDKPKGHWDRVRRQIGRMTKRQVVDSATERLSVLVVLLVLCTSASAETVDVKYRGPVDLKPFTCTETPRSSFVRRVCYDKRNSYMLISLNGTFYHYCGIDDGTVSALLTGESAGRYFNTQVKGKFDCRTGRVPTY